MEFERLLDYIKKFEVQMLRERNTNMGYIGAQFHLHLQVKLNLKETN